jgi:hypothetical protein
MKIKANYLVEAYKIDFKIEFFNEFILFSTFEKLECLLMKC